jgi:3-hydroxyisobutyrate dehydrogenase-like beta-hydroxyacid dehydrogenase/uncharacterized membrane protein YoaK (UPF0700 family)
VDGYGLRAFATYVSFMSGNTTQTGLLTGQGGLAAALPSALVIVFFVAGSFAGTWLTHSGRRHSRRLLFGVVASLLAVVLGLTQLGALDSAAGIGTLSLAMGMMNTTLSRVGGEPVSLTFVTGELNRIGSHLALALKRAPLQDAQGMWDTHLRRAGLLARVWAGFLAGAVLSGAATSCFGARALLPPSLLLLALALFSRAEERSGATSRPAARGCRALQPDSRERSLIMNVGFIGLGLMGAAMAGRLLQAGHEVTVYNRTRGKAQELIARGARPVARVADACQGDAVITMLADDAAVEDVVFGEGGVMQSLSKRTIHVSMNTISVALCGRLADTHATAGQRFVAAQVFGRPDVAAQGKLFIIAAGERAIIDACMPLFDAMGQKTISVGEVPPAANLVKLSGNFLIASVPEALGEAMALIRKAGIDPRRYYELLTSTLFTGPVFTNYGGLIASEKYQPAGLAAPLGEKDIRLTLAAAETLRVPMPLASLVHDRLQTLIARGG